MNEKINEKEIEEIATEAYDCFVFVDKSFGVEVFKDFLIKNYNIFRIDKNDSNGKLTNNRNL